MTFSLDPGAPSGAVVNGSTGLFTWQTSDGLVGTNYNFTARVTDNGSPVKNDARSFSINVVARPGIQNIATTNETVTFTWSAIAGKTYRIQYKTDLNAADWTNLADVTAIASTASKSDSVGSAQTFYRIVCLN